MINDIDITDDTWNSIGNRSNPFVGTFDGQGYSITFESLTGTTTFKNFDGDSNNIDGFGLFGTVGDFSSTDIIEIQNVNIVLESNLTNEASSAYYNRIGSLIGYVNVSSSDYFSMNNCSLTTNGNFEIKGYSGVGGLVGCVYYGTFEDCSVSGDVSVTADFDYAGGLVGYVEAADFTSCSVSGDVSVTAENNHAGGLVGFAATADLTSCSVSGDVSVTAEYDNAGGLVGFAATADLTSCSVSGDVSVIAKNIYAGGLVGNFAGTIANCYSTATVEAKSGVGGLIGFGYGSGSYVCDISSSYFAGTVSFGSGAGTSSKIGGIIGSYDGTPTVSDCVYQDNSVDVGTTGATPTLLGTAKTSAEMKEIATYSSWDISSVPNPSKTWFICENNGYPQLYSLRQAIPISTVDELKKIGSDDYDTMTNHWYTMDADYYLTDDIEITDAVWNSIGNRSNPFLGTFDGQGYSITFESLTGTTTFKNFDGDSNNIDGFGLFGTVGDFSSTDIIEIQNVNIVLESNLTNEASSAYYNRIGSLIGYVNVSSSDYFSMNNCSLTTNGNFEIKGYFGVGGLVGCVYNGTFEDCSVSGDVSVTAGYDYAGGLVGYVEVADFTSCSVSGDVSVTAENDYAGGLVGYVYNNADFMSCSVSGDVSVTAGYDYAGGLVGYVEAADFTSCSVSGDVSVTTGYDFAGGLVGYVYNNADFMSCSVSGDVSVTAENNYAGGLVGWIDTVDFTSCSVSDDVHVTAENSYAGGLAGEFSGTITNCYSTAAIEAKSFVGGLVGRGYAGSSYICDISSSYFAGTVSLGSGADSSSNIGGIIGYPYGTPTVTDSFYSSDSVDAGATGATPQNYGTAVSSDAMKKIGTYQSWSIFSSESPDYVWFITEGQTYPQLSSIYEGIPNYLPKTNRGSSGSGFGQAKIVDSASSIPNVKEDPVPVSVTPVPESGENKNANEDQNANNAPGESYSDESGSNRTLYILLGTGLIIVVGCVAFFLNKKR
ncbi:hypothetical protein MmiEs2_05730 [Methanimicrococcus stummii]|uniref:GLUG domain-containing protein n=1 Tax=Methanimicrococcus stummii TaxID=3028294 RepID=A0AA97A7U3_9EURY|nr:GLUG motif-containing protein [Methanimicrococcus sp. Es2]WNY28388.1 hypothetical protein MmiEs2_05730 [Methanimicrococcus sp. Es2]